MDWSNHNTKYKSISSRCSILNACIVDKQRNYIKSNHIPIIIFIFLLNISFEKNAHTEALELHDTPYRHRAPGINWCIHTSMKRVSSKEYPLIQFKRVHDFFFLLSSTAGSHANLWVTHNSWTTKKKIRLLYTQTELKWHINQMLRCVYSHSQTKAVYFCKATLLRPRYHTIEYIYFFLCFYFFLHIR